MKAIKISETEDHYFIAFDTTVKVQRKFITLATHPALDTDELIICALCKMIMDQEKRYKNEKKS